MAVSNAVSILQLESSPEGSEWKYDILILKGVKIKQRVLKTRGKYVYFLFVFFILFWWEMVSHVLLVWVQRD